MSNWIQGAIKHPGALHKELHVPEGEKIPHKKLEKAEHSKNPLERKRVDLAETLGRMHRKGGGRTKGKMNVNIIIGQPGGNSPPPMDIPAPPPHPVMPPAPMPPPPGLAAGAPAGMPPGIPPPMPRKSGGRTYPIDTGAGGGTARLDKIRSYGRRSYQGAD